METNLRDQLLHQALRLFAGKGYDGVGVQEIVAACNASKPTLYHHFKSKIGLLEGLMDERFCPLLEELETLSASEDFGDTITRCGLAVTAFAAANPDVYRLFLSLIFACPESPQFEVAEAYAQRQFAAIERIFIHAQHDKNAQAAAEISLYAAHFQGLLHNLITLFLHGHIQLEESVVCRTVHLFLHGLHAMPSLSLQNKRSET